MTVLTIANHRCSTRTGIVQDPDTGRSIGRVVPDDRRPGHRRTWRWYCHDVPASGAEPTRAAAFAALVAAGSAS